MNAPKKIYLFENPIDNTPDYRWLSKKSCNDDIEYIRADVFIEKARAWFEMQNEGVDSDGNYKCDMTDFEDFRSYMKGE